MSSPKSPTVRPSAPHPTFRSGAVARMADMPVATLRIWEQRYQAVRPTTAASGHRLYCAADVERVTLLRRLTHQGHAIGLLAPLDMQQLRALASAQPPTSTSTSTSAPIKADASTPLRVVVVGQAMQGRLNASQHLGCALQWVGRFDSLADALSAAKGGTGEPIDLLLWQTAGLQTGVLDELRAVQNAWRAHAVAVAYRFASAGACAELVTAQITTVREPVDDKSLGQWLASLARTARARASQNAAHTPWPLDDTVSPPRFDAATLMAFAGLSTGIACECPSHLAELVLQISSFETYSAGCANRHADDAQLHAYLQRVAGTARMLFEQALERVALAEGLPLPLPTAFGAVVV